MISRIRKAMEEKDQGFTLIELLVVIIILGILAAIAIPIFLNQREKAVDVAAKADVSSLAKHVATYFVDNDAQPSLSISGTTYQLTADGDTTDLGPVSGELGSPSVQLNPGSGADASNFSIVLTYSGGTEGAGASYTYSATSGLTGPTAAGGGGSN